MVRSNSSRRALALDGGGGRVDSMPEASRGAARRARLRATLRAVMPTIPVAAGIALDAAEVQESFLRASGPGGQNVNKLETAVQLRFDAARSPSLPEAVRARLLLMGRRLYGFGHTMFGFALLAGMLLWQGYRVWPATFPNIVAGMGWLHAKLGLVAVLLAYFIWCGRHVKAIAKGAPAGSSRKWRLWNELPIALLFGIIFLALARPF